MTEDESCTLVLRAARFACARHAGQTKPRQKRPVIDHCLEVALLVSGVGLDPEVTAAAILHDTLEKTDTAAHDIEAEFGPRVRALVEAVTDLPWDTEATAKARLKAAAAEAQSIKCADIASNLEALARVSALTVKDLNDKAATLAVLDRANRRLAQRAEQIIAAGVAA
jgi:guanosine-3',5'-bis(diphosphate) 3'-pyrophosphohydrolase